MKTTIKGNYSFRRPSKRKGSNALAIIGFILILISFIAGTQFFAWDVGKNRLPNELFSYAGIKIYSPFEILEWLKLWKKSNADMKDFTDSLIVMGGLAFIGVALISVNIRNKTQCRTRRIYTALPNTRNLMKFEKQDFCRLKMKKAQEFMSEAG